MKRIKDLIPISFIATSVIIAYLSSMITTYSDPSSNTAFYLISFAVGFFIAAVTNVSEKSLIVETLSVSPPYCRVVSDPNVALYSDDSTYISIELDCVEGKYPLMYTLSYSVGLDRVVKRGTFSINVIDDEE